MENIFEISEIEKNLFLSATSEVELLRGKLSAAQDKMNVIAEIIFASRGIEKPQGDLSISIHINEDKIEVRY